MAETPLIAVVGTANLDLIATVDELPEAGQTVLATAYEELPGGKGLNQARAAARAGSAALVAAIGTDAAGEALLDAARRAAVDVSHAPRLVGASGRALIAVDTHAENSIVVFAGVGAELDGPAVTAALDSLSPRTVLAQCEVSADAQIAAAAWARAHAARFVWNCSPVADGALEVLADADPVIVNRGEARELLLRLAREGALPAEATHEDAWPENELPRALAGFARSVVVTLGSRGALWRDSSGADGTVSAVPVAHVVDTTGAGDEFAGAFTAALASGATFGEASARAAAAGAHAVATPRALR
ncbi:MAG TPA: PfkB family carbohydrate kinase [Gryllotalpicola sp.]